MKHSAPTHLDVDQLVPITDSWSDAIASFENLVIEVDNRAARAVRMIPELESSNSGLHLSDEEGSFQVDLNSSTATYAIGQNKSSTPDPRIEFDFPDFPALVRLWDVFNKGSDNLASLMASLFSHDRLSLESLQTKRTKEAPPRPQCPCCTESAKERARYASMHPLFDILMRATQRADILQIRVLSPEADLSIPLLPYRVESNNGVLTAIDKDHTSAFHIDVRWLHAMRLTPVKLDGTTYSMIIGYDSFGGELFHIASPDANDAEAWAECCEWSKQFFSK